VNNHHRCHVVVVSEARLHCSLKILQLYYDVNEDLKLRDVYVETVESIVGYINSGRFILGGRRPAQSGMPGRRPSGGQQNRRPYRVEFTNDDDDALARYLATRIPDKASGGRSGEVIYKELEQLVSGWTQFVSGFTNEGLQKGESGLPNFIWANRHPWQSWRNRYKQHVERIDKVIYQYVKVHNTFSFHVIHRTLVT
jgi:hypothetical protein